jgi:hypothetical protein
LLGAGEKDEEHENWGETDARDRGEGTPTDNV